MSFEDMQAEFDHLAGVLREAAERGPVYYYANPGNWGDGAIRAGTLAFFRDIGLACPELRWGKWRRFEWIVPKLRGGDADFWRGRVVE